jgi:hypothetical protein
MLSIRFVPLCLPGPATSAAAVASSEPPSVLVNAASRGLGLLWTQKYTESGCRIDAPGVSRRWQESALGSLGSQHTRRLIPAFTAISRASTRARAA